MRNFLQGQLSLEAKLPRGFKVLSVETDRPEFPVHLHQRLKHTWRIRVRLPTALKEQEFEFTCTDFELALFRRTIMAAAPQKRVPAPMPVQLELFP